MNFVILTGGTDKILTVGTFRTNLLTWFEKYISTQYLNRDPSLSLGHLEHIICKANVTPLSVLPKISQDIGLGMLET